MNSLNISHTRHNKRMGNYNYIEIFCIVEMVESKRKQQQDYEMLPLYSIFCIITVIKHFIYFLLFFYLQEINYDSARGGVSVITEKGEITTSYLLIQRAKISDSGKYTCSPSHANPQTVNVHVLNGKYYYYRDNIQQKQNV